MKKYRKKDLQKTESHAIIIEHDCTGAMTGESSSARYAMKREVAAPKGPVFPWSMSDFKPGEEFEGLGTAGVSRQAEFAPFKGCDGFSPAPESVRGFRFFDVKGGNTRRCVQKVAARKRQTTIYGHRGRPSPPTITFKEAT